MPTYILCNKIDDSVEKMAARILSRFPTHKPALDAKVRIDFVFASPDFDENGNPCNDALKHHGRKAEGLCKIIPCDRRTKGEADAEIKLDKRYWDSVDEPVQEALLDHELHHISPVTDGKDASGKQLFKLDSNGRPKLKLRKHDIEIGWFNVIAQRQGVHSAERIQAAQIMEQCGQLYWPEIAKVTGRTQHLELKTKG